MSRPRLVPRVALALTLLVGANGSLMAWMCFEVHQEHIAEHLCENRHDPDSECEGFCVLTKRMHDHHGHDHGPSEPAAVATAPVLLAVAVRTAQVPPDRWDEAQRPSAVRPDRPRDGPDGEVFRPPRGAAASVSVLV